MKHSTVTSAERMRARPSFSHTSFIRALFGKMLLSERAAISPMFALLLIPISGSIAYAVELGGAQYIQRSAQNAADAAAIAAATNNKTTGTTFLMEARAAAQPYGYVDGVNNATVTSAVATCPTGTPAGSTCYEAVITDTFPLTFSRIIGFLGTGRAGSQLITARAIAITAGTSGGTSAYPCLTALGSTGVTLSGDGIPAADLTGCIVVSAGSINCNGSGTMNADYALAGSGTSSGCAKLSENDIQPGDSNWTPPPADPYASLSPPATAACGDDPSENSLSSDQSGTLLSYCGDVKLTRDVNLTGANALMVIKNGTLDLNGFTLKTSGTNASTTIIFTGSNTSDRMHYPTSSKANQGTLEIRAPTTGTWKNMALFQDRALTNRRFSGNKNTIDFEYAGNEPTWNISGAAYFPNANTTFKGAIGKYGDEVSCFALIAYSIAISGTGLTIANNTTEDCAANGYTFQTVTIPGSFTREKLVL